MFYAKDLEKLATAYGWARTVKLGRLAEWVQTARERPLIAVGSGGSLSAAHFAALLYRRIAHGQAKHLTPYELVLNEPNLQGVSLVLLSASGDNTDIIGALNVAEEKGAACIAALCMKEGSPLAKASGPHTHVFEENIPTGKDGFVATNTLLATFTLLARAYGAPLLDSFSTPQAITFDPFPHTPLVQIVYGGWAAPVATDIESKLNESGLAMVSINDYRNFAHGRQFGMLSHGSNAHLLALITPETAGIAERTLSLLPAEFSVSRLSTDREGPEGTLDLLIQALFWVKDLAQARGADPSRPNHVPDWVFQIYKLQPL